MLAQLEKPTHDFQALATYLIHGDTHPTPANRVAWTISQNLPTDDPLLAAHYMTATAELSRRCKNACYHAMIAWHPDERPSLEVMQEIARRTLGLAELGEHQTLIMGHGDKAHPHLHMMINRVHPETGRAWSTSHDYRRFDRIMKQLSDEYGFRHVPAHSFDPELTDAADKGPNSNATFAAKRGANTNRPQWSRATARQIGADMSEDLDRATTWDDIEYALAKQGLTLEAKGKGLVAGNRQGYVKFSALGLTTSAKGLARRFGSTSDASKATRRPPLRKPPQRRALWTVDAIDIARALGDRDELRSAIKDARKAQLARRARLSLIRQLMAEIADDLKASTSLKQPRLSSIRSTKSPKTNRLSRT